MREEPTVRIAARALARTASMLAVPMILLVAVPASATTRQSVPLAQVQGDAVPFGVLGPVGVVAIVLGLVGMVAGTVRHRRRNRAVADSEDVAGSEQTTV